VGFSRIALLWLWPPQSFKIEVTLWEKASVFSASKVAQSEELFQEGAHVRDRPRGRHFMDLTIVHIQDGGYYCTITGPKSGKNKIDILSVRGTSSHGE
jgi:hypothetical protein